MSIRSSHCKNQEMSDETTSSASWTDDKHSRFLNSMEASFVRAMFEDKPRPHRDARLDRHLPDSSDSTLDSESTRSTQRAKSLKNGTSEYNKGPRGRVNGGSEERSRRRPISQPSNSYQDQVVPQLENRNVGDEDKKEHHNVP